MITGCYPAWSTAHAGSRAPKTGLVDASGALSILRQRMIPALGLADELSISHVAVGRGTPSVSRKSTSGQRRSSTASISATCTSVTGWNLPSEQTIPVPQVRPQCHGQRRYHGQSNQSATWN